MASFFKGYTIGAPFDYLSWSSNPTTYSFNSSRMAGEWVFQAEEDIVINKLGFWLRARGSQSMPHWNISVEGVDISGHANGSTGCSAIISSGTQVGFRWVDVSPSMQLYKGQLYCMNITYRSGTINGLNAASFGLINNNIGTNNNSYVVYVNSGTRSRLTGQTVMAYGNDDVAYGFPTRGTANSTSIRTSPIDTQSAIRFNITGFETGYYTLRGIQHTISNSIRNIPIRMRIVDPDNNTMYTHNIIDTYQANATAVYYRNLIFTGGSIPFEFNKQYRIVFNQQTGVGVTQMPVILVQNSGDGGIMRGGQSFGISMRKEDTGVWRDSGDRPIFNLIFEDIIMGRSMPIAGSFINATRIAYY